jgi:oxygen-independent coproporphyrinogen-3 oxidase
MLKLRREMGSIAAYRDFTNRLWVTPAKAALAAAVAAAEEPLIEMTRANTFSLYVGIPFCPTRCSYCSFVSHSIGTPEAKKLIAPYLEKLEEEICRTAEIADRLGLQLASVYIGGGTPTTLSAEQLERLLKQITACFGAGAENEFTVEAGRPDTITREKLDALRGKRISINPQTMHDSVLEAIGRKHTAVLAVECYHMAREMGFTQINMDLIAGLPTDTAEGFADSVRQVAALRPENVTVHTLALKRSSVLKATADPFRGAQEIAAMLQSAEETLSAAGYRPYYMYRQSASLGNFENIGRTLPGHICRYNIDMMEETHTILACGAGAVTKLVGQTHAEDEPSGPPLLRVFNYKYPYEYISRFGELMERKKQITDFYLTR